MLPAPPARTLRYWLGLLMCEKREAAGLKRRHVSGVVDIDQVTIKRFETAANETDELDQILAAYAHLLNDDDPRDYYTQAIARWYAEGEAPRVEPDPSLASRAASAEAAARTNRRRAG